MNMPIGMIMLLVIGVLIYFGIAHRILDRMRLTDKQALLFIGAVVLGSFIDIPIMSTPIQVTINCKRSSVLDEKRPINLDVFQSLKNCIAMI